MLNVSRTTVRAALQGLEQDGLISDGGPSAPRSTATLTWHPWPSNAWWASIGCSRSRATQCRPKPIGQWVSAIRGFSRCFDLKPSTEYLLSEKRYTADGQLAIYIRDIVPIANLAPGTPGGSRGARCRRSIPVRRMRARHLVQPIQGALAQIVPMARRKQSDTQLDLARNEPFVRLHERHVSGDGHILAYSVVDVVDRYVRFDVYRRR